MTLPVQVEQEKFAIRSMLRATPGYTLLAYDLAQAESWIVAYLANCKNMKDALKAPKEFGLHNTTARGIFDIPKEKTPNKDMYYLGKKFNHAGNYGTSAMMIAFMVNQESINPPYITISVAESKRLHTKWKELYFEVPIWWEAIQRELRDSRTLRTPYGRVRKFYGRWDDSLFKEAYSYIPQSTVADHCLGLTQKELGIPGGINRIYVELVSKNAVRILNTSHDSVIIECETPLVKEIHEQVYSFMLRPLLVNGEEITIPVDAEIGERWGELEEYKN